MSELVHEVNLFLIFYFESAEDQDFPWDNFLEEWIFILFINSENFYQVRRDVLFIFNKIFEVQNCYDSDLFLADKLLKKYNIVALVIEKLKQEFNTDTAH